MSTGEAETNGGRMHKLGELEVYRKAVVLAKSVRDFTKRWPMDEMFGLSMQFRRAADSIALNTAEGAGTSSRTDFSKEPRTNE